MNANNGFFPGVGLSTRSPLILLRRFLFKIVFLLIINQCIVFNSAHVILIFSICLIIKLRYAATPQILIEYDWPIFLQNFNTVIVMRPWFLKMEPRPGILRYFGPLPVASGGGENVAGPSSSSSRDSKRPANDESDRKAKRPKRELGLRKKVTTVEGWRRKDNLKWIAYESEQHDKSRIFCVRNRSFRLTASPSVQLSLRSLLHFSKFIFGYFK